MEVTVEQSGTCEATVALTVPWNEFKSQVESSLRHHGRHVRLKGFRPGKVPLSILEKQFGEQARNETIEHYLTRAFQQAVQEKSLKPVGNPQIARDDVKLEEGDALRTTFAITLRPEIELGDYKGLAVESQLEPVMDQELESALEDLRRQRSRPEPAGDEGLQADGMAICKVRWEKDGQTLLEREGLRFSPQQAPPGVESSAFEQALVGAKPGDARELPMTLPPDMEPEELRGQPATCHLEISEAYDIVPPTDEEIQELLEVEDWQGVLDLARRKIGEAKEQQEERRIETELLERVMASHEFDLPERMIENQVHGREHQLQHQLEEQGMDEAAIQQELESQRAELRQQTERGVKAFFLVSAIAEKEDVKVEQKDLVEELRGIAERNQATFEEVRDYYTKNRLIEQVALELLERKVRAFLRENAQITQPG